MELLDSLIVPHPTEERRIGIYQGDLTDLTPDEAVDVLVVSAFPNDYSPTSGSLIGALDRKGVSVDALSRDKAVDLRETVSCWLSDEIHSDGPGIQFGRILCFEPLVRGRPPEVVGDIFRSLVAVSAEGRAIRSVAMPLVATGDQHVPASDMIDPLLDAGVHWMSLELPLRELKIVARSPRLAAALATEFAARKPTYAGITLPSRRPAYDVFVSYSHDDSDDASILVQELQRLRPGLRVFVDRLTLDVGVAWQQEAYDAIDASRRFLSLLSPSYIKSKICLEEFHIALCRRRVTGDEILYPVYLYSAELPTYMQALVNYDDCREADLVKLRAACDNLVAALS